MKIEEFYKLVKDIMLIEREGRDFHSHLDTILGAYLVAYEDIDDSCFKVGSGQSCSTRENG